MKFRIYYADGSEFTSGDGEPEDAPLDGVLRIMEYPDSGGRRLVEGNDYYLFVGPNWISGERADLDRWIRAGYVRPGVVKFGLWVSDPANQRSLMRAMESDCEGC